MALAKDKAQRRRPMSQINVVPFIDVMLVLLIIFMVTAPLLQQGVEVDLPEAHAEALERDQDQGEPVVVTVARDGQVTLNQGPRVNEPLDRDALSDIVAGLLSERPGVQVYVRGDRHVDYGRVVDAMVTVQTAGVARVGLITDPAEPDR
ncbi:protein TolR [Thioalkalivibrio denitrificans]|uniref:Tol-Pal system protein TolR n=1 Tax=Thioalkalivibrio denitrificans TaxID=108003 RepID=A0A1V3NKM7_9GAMM|nr:protein TolR [Thioalkalivibrio denitrificans]OOG25615.1 protein TolR [Thioalkalivibrio denitrificans]